MDDRTRLSLDDLGRMAPRGLELYYDCIGGRRSANACTLLRVPTPGGRINQKWV